MGSGTFLELFWMGCGCERTGISRLLVFLGFNREQSDGSASVGLLGWFLARWELCEMEIGSLAGARGSGKEPGNTCGARGLPLRIPGSHGILGWICSHCGTAGICCWVCLLFPHRCFHGKYVISLRNSSDSRAAQPCSKGLLLILEGIVCPGIPFVNPQVLVLPFGSKYK